MNRILTALLMLASVVALGCSSTMIITRLYPSDEAIELHCNDLVRKAQSRPHFPWQAQPSASECSEELKATRNEPTVGTIYFLPKRLMKFTLKRAPKDLKELKKSRDDKEKANQEIAGAARTAKAEAELARAIADAANARAKEQAEQNALIAKARSEVLEAAAKRAAADLAVADEVYKQALADPSTFVDEIKLELLPPAADTKRMFVAEMRHRISREDDLDIAISKQGLLETVKSVSTDRTPEIVVEVVKTLVEITKLVARFGVAPMGDDKDKPFVLERIFDASSNEDLCLMNTELSRFEYSVAVDNQPAPEPDTNRNCAGFGAAASAGLSLDPSLRIDGLVYRRHRSHIVSVLAGDRAFTSVVVDLPNDGALAVLPLDNGPFVRTEYDVAFTEGNLTKHDQNRPSEALGFAMILPNALREIASLPTDLIQLKIDYSSKEAALLENQKAILDATQALEEARAASKATPADAAGSSPQ